MTQPMLDLPQPPTPQPWMLEIDTHIHLLYRSGSAFCRVVADFGSPNDPENLANAQHVLAALKTAEVTS